MTDQPSSRVLERDLEAWLVHIDRLHPSEIEMGLERVREVAGRLDVLQPAQLSIIVAGTNGKGSTAVFTEALLLELGYTVGTTLSPHVECFNERVRINGELASDSTLSASFAAVEEARADVPLTYFEFAALAALVCFSWAGVDVAILEVGLGGRLDAFNIVDADIAVVTSIGVDHVEYLGDDVEQIGREKAGVFRPGQVVILGDAVTESVHACARELNCRVVAAGAQFNVQDTAGNWGFRAAGLCLPDLPHGALAAINCGLGISTAMWVVQLLPRGAKLNASAVLRALHRARLPGRFETLIQGDRRFVLDVAHNPAGAEFLRRRLERVAPAVTALIGSLRDKDTTAMVAALKPMLVHVVCVATDGARGLEAQQLAARLPPGTSHECAANLADAVETARSLTGPGDVILICGSFAVVGSARSLLKAEVDAAIAIPTEGHS